MNRFIMGYDKYLVDDTGGIYGLKSKRYLKPLLNARGYYRVSNKFIIRRYRVRL